jgi:hypothetical protein
METYLAVRWTTSRGRDTYGYNICTVTDQVTGKRYRCNGGGYDMLGTSIGEWLADNYQAELLAIKDQAYTRWTETHTGPWDQVTNKDGLYGMNYYVTGNRIVLDGACGISSIETIAKAAGIKLERTYGRGHGGGTTGYVVSSS